MPNNASLDDVPAAAEESTQQLLVDEGGNDPESFQAELAEVDYANINPEAVAKKSESMRGVDEGASASYSETGKRESPSQGCSSRSRGTRRTPFEECVKELKVFKRINGHCRVRHQTF